MKERGDRPQRAARAGGPPPPSRRRCGLESVPVLLLPSLLVGSSGDHNDGAGERLSLDHIVLHSYHHNGQKRHRG